MERTRCLKDNPHIYVETDEFVTFKKLSVFSNYEETEWQLKLSGLEMLQCRAQIQQSNWKWESLQARKTERWSLISAQILGWPANFTSTGETYKWQPMNGAEEVLWIHRSSCLLGGDGICSMNPEKKIILRKITTDLLLHVIYIF